MIKQRLPQKTTLDKSQSRDCFQTPRYATELLVPFISYGNIWECAAGEGRMAAVLREHFSSVKESDINPRLGIEKINFLYDDPPYNNFAFIIITNPPYSLKRQFIKKAVEYNVPFAFLISSDWSGYLIDLFKIGCQAIIPTRRIDYITPTGLSGASGHTSYFHSYWITRYFSLKNQITFVDLTRRIKRIYENS